MTADPARDLDQYLAERRTEVEAALRDYMPAPPDTPQVLADAMRYSLLAGGKRLRPLLVLAAADAVAGADARSLAMPAACAIEMIHTYSLVHDDLPAMDDDTLRRGRPTLHVVVGDGMAILAGDGLQAEAFRLLARAPASSDPHIALRKLRVLDVIASAAGPAGMVGGQAIDLGAAFGGEVSPAKEASSSSQRSAFSGKRQAERRTPTGGAAPSRPGAPFSAHDLEEMHARKTGAIIRAAAVSGAVMAGASEVIITAIDRYAAEIGLAFQIVDDVLDVEAGSDALGKTAGKDAAAGKPTYPALFGLARSRELAADCLARAEGHLASVELQRSHLAGIARWIVARRS
jgi:geranylgeranyl diphosphate synthase type II